MRKVVMFVVMLCCTLSGFAEKKPIQLEKEKQPHKRNEVLLPIASIDGQILTIDFTSSTTFKVQVADASGTIVYMETYNVQHAMVTLPQLSEGVYKLTIEDNTYIYSGYFDIEE